MKSLFAMLSLIITAVLLPMQPAVSAPSEKPTIVLVQGAFADSYSWYGVIATLEKMHKMAEREGFEPSIRLLTV